MLNIALRDRAVIEIVIGIVIGKARFPLSALFSDNSGMFYYNYYYHYNYYYYYYYYYYHYHFPPGVPE